MNMHIRKFTRVTAAIVITGGTALGSAAAQETTAAEETYTDIEATLGQVPTMLEVFPEAGISDA